MSVFGRVWTALRWQVVSWGCHGLLVGAAMCSAFDAALHAPPAMMPFARIRSRPKARTRSASAKMGFPDPAVSTGLVHQLLSALPNIIGIAVRAPDSLCLHYCRFTIALAARHQRPHHASGLVREGDCGDFGRAPG